MRIKEIVREKTKDWVNKLNKDEWFFANLRENVFEGKSSEEAFKMIPELVDLVIGKRTIN